jgi:hypothetical protein
MLGTITTPTTMLQSGGGYYGATAVRPEAAYGTLQTV